MALEHAEQLLLQRRPGQHSIQEIWSVERADEFQWIVQGKRGGDIVPDARGGGCCIGVQADAG